MRVLSRHAEGLFRNLRLDAELPMIACDTEQTSLCNLFILEGSRAYQGEGACRCRTFLRKIAPY